MSVTHVVVGVTVIVFRPFSMVSNMPGIDLRIETVHPPVEGAVLDGVRRGFFRYNYGFRRHSWVPRRT